jgi:hypothetical protein
VIFNSIKNISPSHLLDQDIYDFKELVPVLNTNKKMSELGFFGEKD